MSSLVVEIARMEAERHVIKKYILSDAIINTDYFENQKLFAIGHDNIAIVRDIVLNVNYVLTKMITKGYPIFTIESEDKKIYLREFETYAPNNVGAIYMVLYKNKFISVHRGFIKGTVVLPSIAALDSGYLICTIINNLDKINEQEKK